MNRGVGIRWYLRCPSDNTGSSGLHQRANRDIDSAMQTSRTVNNVCRYNIWHVFAAYTMMFIFQSVCFEAKAWAIATSQRSPPDAVTVYLPRFHWESTHFYLGWKCGRFVSRVRFDFDQSVACIHFGSTLILPFKYALNRLPIMLFLPCLLFTFLLLCEADAASKDSLYMSHLTVVHDSRSGVLFVWMLEREGYLFTVCSRCAARQ